MRNELHKEKNNGWLILTSLILTAFYALGFIIAISQSHNSIVGVVKENITSVLLLSIILFLFFKTLLYKIYSSLDGHSNQMTVEAYESTRLNGLCRDTFKKGGIIAACWLPYLIICYPTITRGYDYFWQLLQGMGAFPLSNHHPVLGSLVFALLFRIGYSIGGAIFGLFFTSLVQVIALSSSIGFALAMVEKTTYAPTWVRRGSLLFLCICPIFPGHAVWVTKDTFFTAIGVLLFTQIYIRLKAYEQRIAIPPIASYPAIAVSAALFSLFRNGVTVIAIIAIGMLLCFEIRKGKGIRKDVWKCAGTMAGVLLIVSACNCILSVNNVYPTDQREALALPTRQIIRTIQLHPEVLDDTSVEETIKEAYHEQIKNGVFLKDVVNNYDDMNADNIKIDYVEDNRFLPVYLKLWLSLGIKHPGSYIDAFLRGTDGYWYPMKSPHLEARGEIIHTVCTTGPEEDFTNEDMRKRKFNTLFLPTVKSLEKAGYNVEQTFENFYNQYPWLSDLMHVKSAFPNGREQFGELLAQIEGVPVVSMILAPGTYLSIMIVTFGYLFSRKKNEKYLWPVFLVDLLAWLSPVNGYTRYVLLIEAFSIIIIGMCFGIDMEHLENKSEEERA